MSNVLKFIVPLYIIFENKLITPLINAKNDGREQVIRTRGNLVQAINVVRLTNAQLTTNTVVKNITECSSSCKNQEVFGIPSLLELVGRERLVKNIFKC